MPMRYADANTVLAALDIDAGDTTTVARVEALEHALADLFDDKTGTTFSADAPVAETRAYTANAADVLVINEGVRSVTGIDTDGTWNGATYDDETALLIDEWRLWAVSRDGIAYGIERVDGGAFDGVVRVTGIFGDQQAAGIPADVTHALNLLTVEQYRRMTSSPQNFVGPDGSTIPTPDGWSEPDVRAAIQHHRLVEVIV